MYLDLLGKAAVVTGASRGIGRAVAAALAAANADVTIVSRKEASLQQAVAEIEATGVKGRVRYSVANAGEPDQAEAAVRETVDAFGSIDILVNNAATNPYLGDLVDIDIARAEKTARVNQLGIVLWTQAAWRAGMSDHGGAIVNVASIGGMTVDRGIGYYNATKAAVLSLTRQFAVELAPGVRVNAVAPGLIRTDMSRQLFETREEELTERHPLKRLGTPEDIASAVTFLVSDEASWITGQTLVVDGGVLVAPIHKDS